MKRKILTVLAILLGLAGLGVLLYPSVSNWMEQAKQRRQIAAYQEAQAQMEQERRAALLAEADRYNQKLAELGISFDMLGEAEKEALLIDGKSYDELLLAEDSGVMGYLEIGKIKLKLPIYHGVSEEALESGVGHLEGTSLPVGGETTHAILFGHRGLPSAKLFTDLDQLEVGDTFTITVLDSAGSLYIVKGDNPFCLGLSPLTMYRLPPSPSTVIVKEPSSSSAMYRRLSKLRMPFCTISWTAM